MRKTLLLPLLACCLSCSVIEVHLEDEASMLPMQLELSPLEPSEPGTRSVLTSSGIEDRISHATVAAYDSRTGMLADIVHSGTSPSLTLSTGCTYNIYVIANLGDLTSSFPVQESQVASMRCPLKSYSSMNSVGIPMAGKVTTPWRSGIILGIRRLMAKAVITVRHSDMSAGGSDRAFSNTVVKVHRAAAAVYPFAAGGSAARSSADISTGEAEYQTVSDGYAATSESLVLYIPENMQGTLLSGNTDQWNKSESNGSLDASLCTYISLEGVKDGTVDGVAGDFTYRFFPGGDNSRNFDLQGNKVYDISMVLTWNGMYVTDNWKVEKSGWSDTRMIGVSTSRDGGYTSSASLVLARGSDRVPVYVFYSPHGMRYETEESGGTAHHLDRGWVFMPKYSPSDGSTVTTSKANTSEYSGTYMSTGFVSHDAYRTTHYVSIPKSTAAGYTNRISYRTADWRKNAYLDIKVAAPTISLTPASMYSAYNEYGSPNAREIALAPESTVKPCNISSVTTDNSNVVIEPYDTRSGSVKVYWRSANTSSAARTAKVTFTSACCGVSASCVLTQQNKGGLVIGGEEDGGNADIEY